MYTHTCVYRLVHAYLQIVLYAKSAASGYDFNPVIWLLKSHSFSAALSSKEAAVVNGFSLQSEKYFPDTPSSSSATAQWMAVWAACLGVFMKRTDTGYAISYKGNTAKDKIHYLFKLFMDRPLPSLIWVAGKNNKINV